MDPNETGPLDPKAAMELLTDAREKAGRAFDINGALLYGAWALAWLVGYLAIWLSVRGQATYRGPDAWAIVLLSLCMVGALVVTVRTIGTAARGVTGLSSTSGSMFGFSWAVAFACFYAILASLVRAGISDEAIGLLAGAGPALVVSIIYLVGGALWLDWTMFVVGAWLALVVGVAVMFGPVVLGLLMAIFGGGGFLVAAAYEWRRRRL